MVSATADRILVLIDLSCKHWPNLAATSVVRYFMLATPFKLEMSWKQAIDVIRGFVMGEYIHQTK